MTLQILKTNATMATVLKTYSINASVEKVYQALTDEVVITTWSGAKATMDLQVEGIFSLWEGSIHGKNLVISKTQIVQSWKEDNWEEFSTVTFNLIDKGNVTGVELIHEHIPEKSMKSIDNGWDKYYMFPLKEYVENK